MLLLLNIFSILIVSFAIVAALYKGTYISSDNSLLNFWVQFRQFGNEIVGRLQVTAISFIVLFSDRSDWKSNRSTSEPPFSLMAHWFHTIVIGGLYNEREIGCTASSSSVYVFMRMNYRPILNIFITGKKVMASSSYSLILLWNN